MSEGTSRGVRGPRRGLARGSAPALFELVQRSFSSRDRIAIATLLLLLLCALYLSMLPISGAFARFALARSHMRVAYPVWAAMQVVPAMYSFENRWLVFVEPKRSAPARLFHASWINHHPTRALYEPERRVVIHSSCARNRFLSRYREHELSTDYRVCHDPEGRRLVVERDAQGGL